MLFFICKAHLIWNAGYLTRNFLFNPELHSPILLT
jgi:hypothetical protein